MYSVVLEPPEFVWFDPNQVSEGAARQPIGSSSTDFCIIGLACVLIAPIRVNREWMLMRVIDLSQVRQQLANGQPVFWKHYFKIDSETIRTFAH
jgi:hypothetical protein